MYVMVKDAQLFNYHSFRYYQKMGLKLKQTLHGGDSNLENFSTWPSCCYPCSWIETFSSFFDEIDWKWSMPVAQLLNSRFPNCYEQFIKINEPIIHSVNRRSHLKHGNLYDRCWIFSYTRSRKCYTSEKVKFFRMTKTSIWKLLDLLLKKIKNSNSNSTFSFFFSKLRYRIFQTIRNLNSNYSRIFIVWKINEREYLEKDTIEF